MVDGYPAHRTPMEEVSDALDEVFIDHALANARADLMAWAVCDGSDAEEYERRVSACYRNLREALSEQQLTRAVLLLLQRERR